jgi:hypothetical protein
MPDFTAPAYTSYLSLCRELRLEREWTNGDWFALDGAYVHHTTSLDDAREDPESIWVPRLADWLDILEEVGIDSVTIERINHVWFARGFDANGHGGMLGGSTREEALARLWMSVRPPG